MPNGPVPTPRAAARQLLGRRLDYEGGASSVEPYREGCVSLPEGLVEPVALPTVLDPDTLATLNPDRMLADDDVIEYRKEYESVGMYTDSVLGEP